MAPIVGLRQVNSDTKAGQTGIRTPLVAPSMRETISTSKVIRPSEADFRDARQAALKASKAERAKNDGGVLGFSPAQITDARSVAAEISALCHFIEPQGNRSWFNSTTGAVDKDYFTPLFFGSRSTEDSLDRERRLGKLSGIDRALARVEKTNGNKNDVLAIGIAKALSRDEFSSTSALGALMAAQLFVSVRDLSEPVAQHLVLALEYTQIQAACLVCAPEARAINGLVNDLFASMQFSGKVNGPPNVGVYPFIREKGFDGAGGSSGRGPIGPEGFRSVPQGDSKPLTPQTVQLLGVLRSIAYTSDPTIAGSLDRYDVYKAMAVMGGFGRYLAHERAWNESREAAKAHTIVNPGKYDALGDRTTLPDTNLLNAARVFLDSQATQGERFTAIVHCLEQGPWRVRGTAALLASAFVDMNQLDKEAIAILRGALDKAAEKDRNITFPPVSSFLLGANAHLKETIDYHASSQSS